MQLTLIRLADGELAAAEEEDHSEETEGGAEEEHAEEEESNPILPETNELIWGSISFLLLFLLLAKLAYPPVRQAMEDRTEKIRGSIDEAEKAKDEANQVLDQYRAQLADARNESARIIEEARQTADQLRRDLQQRAEAEIAEMRTRAQDEINAAKDRAMAEVRAQVSELAISAAELVVSRNLDRETNRQLVDQFIEQVGSTR